MSGNDLILKTYSYDLESSSSDETTIGGSWDYPPGNGIFFKALCLDNDYVAIISNPNYLSSNDKQMTLSLCKYENSFECKFKKNMEYTNKNADLYNNDFYKINNNRLIFVTKDDKLYFYLFDLFDNYSKIIINIM